MATTADNILIYGDITMIADFDAGTMTGDIGNLQGADNISENGADTFDVAGAITVGGQSSNIGGIRANDWAADYAGTLTIPYGDYVFDGVLDGQFVGTDPNNPDLQIRDIYAQDLGGIVLHNGGFIPVFIDIGAAVVLP